MILRHKQLIFAFRSIFLMLTFSPITLASQDYAFGGSGRISGFRANVFIPNTFLHDAGKTRSAGQLNTPVLLPCNDLAQDNIRWPKERIPGLDEGKLKQIFQKWAGEQKTLIAEGPFNVSIDVKDSTGKVVMVLFVPYYGKKTGVNNGVFCGSASYVTATNAKKEFTEYVNLNFVNVTVQCPK